MDAFICFCGHSPRSAMHPKRTSSGFTMLSRAYKAKSGCTWIDFCNQCRWQLIKQPPTHFRVGNLGATDRGTAGYQWTFTEREKKISFLPGKCKDLDKLLETNISPGEKGSSEEQNPFPSQRPCGIWDAYCQLPQQRVHSGEGGRITQASPRTLATSATGCSLTYNSVSWVR